MAKQRLAPVPEADYSPEQKVLAEKIGGARRGAVGGPFAMWLHVPDICEPVNGLSERLRAQSRFDKRLYELMVLAVTRVWSAEYAFAAHAPQGVKAGLSQAVVDAIAQRRTPAFERDDERVLFDTVTELVQNRSLSQTSYDRALAQFGKEMLIELVTDAGLYSMLSMILVTFDVPAPNDGHPFP